MSYRKAIGFVDDLFRSFIVFVLVFIWCRYFIDGLFLALSIATIITIVISIAIMRIRKTKNDALNLTAEQKRNMDDVCTYLLLSTHNEIMNIFNKQIMGKICGKLIVKNNHIYIPYFNQETFDINNMYNLLKTTPYGYPIEIIAISFDPKVVKLSKELKTNNIILTSKEKMYTKYLKDIDIDIKRKLSKASKTNFREFLKLFIRPENAKGYLFSALYILLACLIVPQKIYYMIFASILLVLALICNTNKRKALHYSK